jgi:hypothetical protein
VTSRLAALAPAPAIILISSHDEAELDELVSRSAARGFLPKEELSRAAIEKLL